MAKTRRLHLLMDEELYQQIRRRAGERGMSVNEWVAGVARHVLAANAPGKRHTITITTTTEVTL